jgi:16S rRNA U516 pseudouridylate synthase RsuA-like enzyme
MQNAYVAVRLNWNLAPTAIENKKMFLLLHKPRDYSERKQTSQQPTAEKAINPHSR